MKKMRSENWRALIERKTPREKQQQLNSHEKKNMSKPRLLGLTFSAVTGNALTACTTCAYCTFLQRQAAFRLWALRKHDNVAQVLQALAIDIYTPGFQNPKQKYCRLWNSKLSCYSGEERTPKNERHIIHCRIEILPSFLYHDIIMTSTSSSWRQRHHHDVIVVIVTMTSSSPWRHHRHMTSSSSSWRHHHRYVIIMTSSSKFEECQSPVGYQQSVHHSRSFSWWKYQDPRSEQFRWPLSKHVAQKRGWIWNILTIRDLSSRLPILFFLQGLHKLLAHAKWHGHI